MNKEWRPADWIDTRIKYCLEAVGCDGIEMNCNDCGTHKDYSAGASAMLVALIKEIEERFGDGYDRPILLSSPARWEAFKKEITHDRTE
jgi:hypothetical protein